MLVEVNATTRFRDGVTRCGSAPANKPTWAVQYRVETGGHTSLSGVARSACSQATFCSARRVRDTATGFSPACTSRSTICPPTIPLAPMTMLPILPTRQAQFQFGPFVNTRVGEELLAALAAQANARPCSCACPGLGTYSIRNLQHESTNLSFETFLRRWRFWPRPPMSTFEQYAPRPLRNDRVPASPALSDPAPRIAIVTPSYNQCNYLSATVDSVLAQNYPALSYHVQDAASQDGTVELLESYGPNVSWRSEPDTGQANAINKGFRLTAADCDIMAYLNSDDTLLPGTLAYVAHVFQTRPDIDIVYGQRIFIDGDGMEIGRAVFPTHDARALNYIGYVPQEKRCSGGAAFGIGSGRSTRAFVSRWIGISCCVPSRPVFKWFGFRASLAASASTLNRKPRR